jgi:glycosyltransferase involved in cell wall biosynthesis
MNTPKLTVLMPVYNCEPYLREAIDSILQQTFSDFEFLIINDASTDASEEIILSYTDPRIKYVKNDVNLRLVGTLNRGLDLIATPYMVRMDGDDVSTPDRLQKLFSYMESNPDIGVCGSFIETFGNDNTVWKYDEDDEMIRPCVFYKSMIGHASAIFRMSVLNENGIRYSERHMHMEDRVMWLSLFHITKFHNLQEVLYKYRILEHNVTVKNKDSLKERVTAFYAEVFKFFEIDISTEVLSVHVGYAPIGQHRALEIQSYIDWLNISFTELELRKLGSKKALGYHLNVIRERLLSRIYAGGTSKMLRIALAEKSFLRRTFVLLMFRFGRK